MLRKHTMLITVLPAFMVIISIPCFPQAGNRTGSTEKLEMKIDTSDNILSFDRIEYQKAYTMDERGGRGIISSFLISKGVQGIQSLIDNRKKKFSADYFFAIKDESFYDQVSTEGPFDPTGIRFKGFTVARVQRGQNNHGDTVFIAKFSMDTSAGKITDILNNGIFKLRLDTFAIKNSRVRLPKHLKELNLDFEINFFTSYISNTGQIFQDVPVGKFIYSIRNAPMDPDDPSYSDFYRTLAKKHPACTGQSFLIPRSSGYFKNEDTKKIEPCWGDGIYSVRVAVKECSKNSFIDKLILFSSGDLLSLGNSSLQKKYGSTTSNSTKSTGNSKSSSTNTQKVSSN
ncbi:MAG: hypothetical protein JST17_10325 [Bacteroidetes bacterium]|nr:hypothetical protein [Bacteroidota bacterium]MBS1930291.1 hypothetical protein [Bacteroidota bacterium]